MITDLDHLLFHFINQSIANPVLDAICPHLRNKYTWIPIYVVSSIYMLYKYRLQGLWMVLFAGLVIVASDQASNLIKLFVHRVRPCHLKGSVRLLIGDCSDNYCFPSNYAANHFALIVFVSLIFRMSKCLPSCLLIWASLVSFSQVYVGVHYPADILSGAILGAAIGWLVFIIFDRILHLGLAHYKNYSLML